MRKMFNSFTVITAVTLLLFCFCGIYSCMVSAETLEASIAISSDAVKLRSDRNDPVIGKAQAATEQWPPIDKLKVVLRKLNKEDVDAIINVLSNAPKEYSDFFYKNLDLIEIVTTSATNKETGGIDNFTNSDGIHLNFASKTSQKDRLVVFFHECGHLFSSAYGSAKYHHTGNTKYPHYTDTMKDELEDSIMVDLYKYLLGLIQQDIKENGLRGVTRFYRLCNVSAPTGSEINRLIVSAVTKIMNGGFKEYDGPNKTKDDSYFYYYYYENVSGEEMMLPISDLDFYGNPTQEEIMIKYIFELAKNSRVEESLTDEAFLYRALAFGGHSWDYYLSGSVRSIFDELWAVFIKIGL